MVSDSYSFGSWITCLRYDIYMVAHGCLLFWVILVLCADGWFCVSFRFLGLIDWSSKWVLSFPLDFCDNFINCKYGVSTLFFMISDISFEGYVQILSTLYVFDYVLSSWAITFISDRDQYLYNNKMRYLQEGLSLPGSVFLHEAD